MAQIDVMEQLKDRFSRPLADAAARRIVVWHDPDGEFSDTFDGLVAHGFDGVGATDGVMAAGGIFARPVRFVRADDNTMFATKRLIARQDTTSDILLYRPRPAGVREGDWLADIELYAESFQADYLSLLASELGAEDAGAVRNALGALRRFFAAKARVARFSQVMPAPARNEDVALGVVAVLLGGSTPSAASPSFVVRATLMALRADGPEDLVDQFQKYDALAALEAIVRRRTGYKGSLADRDAAEGLACHLLLSAASQLVPPGAFSGLEARMAPECGPFCLSIVRDWMACTDADAQDSLRELCSLVESSCKLVSRFSKMRLEGLTDLDIFPCVNEAILSGLLALLPGGGDCARDARAAIQARRGLAWYDDYACYFDLLGALAAMSEFYAAHASGFHLAKPVEVWEAYTSDWWQMDHAYRTFGVAARACNTASVDKLEEAWRAAADWADNLYENWFIPQTNACWAAASNAQWRDAGYVEGVPRQDEFYWQTLPGYVGDAKTSVVIVSDALRYEVARDVAAALERERGGNVQVGSMQAVFPSITEMGMPALLPHHALQLNWQPATVSADGRPTANTQQRQTVIQQTVPSGRALSASAFLDMPASERRELLSGSDLVYLYHNQIDAVGEKGAMEDKVFDACSDTVEELVALARRVCLDAPSARVVITADHGFLYTRRAVGECQKLDGAEVPDSPVLAGKRHVVVRASADTPAFDSSYFARVNMGCLGEFEGLSPLEAVRLKRRGGTQRYVHGGLTLQELCVPVIGFWRARSGSRAFEDTTVAQVRILSESRRITNSLFSVKLIQEQPACGKVLPATYELELADVAGTAISDTARVVADVASDNSQERVLTARFALRGGVQTSSKETYYLTCRNAQSGEVAWSEAYKVDVAFAPLDDFGF